MTVLALHPAAKPIPMARVSYAAFRIADTDAFGQPRHDVITIGEPATLKDALAAALLNGCVHHREHIAIRETGIRLRQWATSADEIPFDRVHLFQIKRKSRARYEGPFGERRVHDLYAEAVAVLPGAVFE